MAKITLKNMAFHAYHGVLEHEKINGNDFLVTASFELDTRQAAASDLLADTLNYQEVYDLVSAEMAVRSDLIEHVVHRIYTRLSQRFPQITDLHVQLQKCNPPLGGPVEGVIINLP
jgi:dihydroneopterin aldolase